MAPKVAKALKPDPTKIKWNERIAGGACLCCFVSIWLASLSSPFIFAVSLWYQYYTATVAIVLITVVAYLPWKPGFLAESVRYIIKTWTPYYFKSIVIAFQGNSSEPAKLPTPNDPPTFYAVHPHGAFCIGCMFSNRLPCLFLSRQLKSHDFFLSLLGRGLAFLSRCHATRKILFCPRSVCVALFSSLFTRRGQAGQCGKSCHEILHATGRIPRLASRWF